MENFQGNLQAYIDIINGYLWGWPMLILLISTGVYYTFILKGLQFHLLPQALYKAFSRKQRQITVDEEGDISNFQSLMMALSATVGPGNIAGVATAIVSGGAGAIFWMWITGLLGMVTKYAEAVLGVHYRVKNSDGEMCGGPMYYISYGLKNKWLAKLFAFFLMLGALCIGGLLLSNASANVMKETFNVEPLTTGIVLAIFTAIVTVGGVKRIGKVSSHIVPVMILLYVITGLIILVMNASEIPSLLAMIFNDAFTGTAAVGGFAGAVVKEAMRYGLARGVFSNESGLGTGPIAAASAKTKHPVDQALISMTQTFIDTLVVCTFTGLIILTTDIWMLSDANGSALTAQAFGAGLNHLSIFGIEVGALIVSVCLVFFAYSSIVGWGGFYGEKAVEFLAGSKKSAKQWIKFYRVLLIALIPVGTIMKLTLVWSIGDICVGLLIVPNLLALILLSGKVKKLTVDYLRNQKDGKGYKITPFYRNIKQ